MVRCRKACVVWMAALGCLMPAWGAERGEESGMRGEEEGRVGDGVPRAVPCLVADSVGGESIGEKVAAKAEGLKKKAGEERKKLREKAAEQKELLRAKTAEKKERLRARAGEMKERGMAAKVKADSVLDARNARVRTDTMWVARPQCTWTFRGKADMIGDVIHLRTGDESGNPSDYYLTARPKVTMGASANYRGISLSLSFSPTKWLSDISDIISSLNYYSNQFGGEVTMELIDEFDGHSELLGRRTRLDNTTLRAVTASGYYVLNGRRFSYPAVFNSTWEQRRSAGSVVVQANFNWERLKMGNPAEMDAEAYDNVLNRIDMRSVSIGVGYGYNLVLPPHWLIHLTAQPSVMLWKSFKLHLTDGEGGAMVEKMPSGHFNLHMTGRVGATYSWSKYFLGITGVVHSIKTGRDADISVRDTKWQGRAFFGLRM